MGMPSLVGHLDADCFYVSCERVRSPALLRLPVGVLGNQGACVIAKSYEMKALGVRTGMPIWESVKKLSSRTRRRRRQPGEKEPEGLRFKFTLPGQLPATTSDAGSPLTDSPVVPSPAPA
jgi:hypothetical protein